MTGTIDVKEIPHEKFHGVGLAIVCAVFSEILLFGSSDKLQYLDALGRCAVIVLSIYILDRFAKLSLSSYKPTLRDNVYLGLSILVSILLVWLGRLIAVGVGTYLSTHGSFPGLKVSNLFFGIPYATCAIVIQAVLGLHFGLVFSAILTLLVGVYFPNEPLLSFFVLASCLIGCISFTRFRSRAAYLKAALNIALFSLPIVLGTLFLEPSARGSDYLLRCGVSIVGAILCAFIASGLTPIVEYLGGYVTDMRLIEIATLDHPLLKELSLRAQGTWNHSMVMGMMVESAADAVGANAVVARVGAYFHDIGKMNKPLYFVENQFGEENRHDKLSPSMSALIIRSHVKDGIELAENYKLPRIIIDMIPQHHGTSLIEYFYEKASKDAADNNQEVDINLYTYPGPKPQTKEAGILMLADCIEAASRTLSEPNHDRIQGLVQKLINKVFASGELDECELTLKDLHLIAKCFTRVLHGIHHQRIAYAEPAEKANEAPQESERPNQVEEQTEKPQTKEDLKRLGI